MSVLVYLGGRLPHLSPVTEAGALAFVAATSMIVGNLMAIAPVELKRLLAFRRRACGVHPDRVIAGGRSGLSAAVLLLSFFVYMFMNFGAFAVVTLLPALRATAMDSQDLEGLAQRNPLMAVLMSIFMLSLAGFPPTVGFFGKAFLFNGRRQRGLHVAGRAAV